MRQTILQYIRRCLLPCVLFIFSATVAHAHESSTAYLNLSPSATDDGTNYRAQYELSLRDLAVLVDIDPNQDKAVSWAEVTAQQNLIQQLISAQVVLKGDDKACHITDFAPLALNTRGGFNYLYTDFAVDCQAPISLLDYEVLAGIDANHRLILTQADTDTAVQVLTVGDIHEHRQISQR